MKVPLPGRFRDELDGQMEFRMGVFRINVELQDGTIVKDLFTNGNEIYRLVGWDSPDFTGEQGELEFCAADIKDLWSVRD